ncbi:hypothetical protein FNF27_00987 [Cafeteria roenbergensis]|uniref:Protein kinase domain-containing protein n=1 Tax=Cafeteria roenbergensis TaxID=33653 RepID=A0A5A8CW68_CAFRO|nr:hypothetical protein FNF29_01232 [Cafeteria roenbergensis]KAA0177816.1 hypothetical protein FNF27_00987 [Cafeteria roenbergensis]|eukprot:KAA0156440.1 hypothetical protein FNF29_01232 [Cafeteria roenbergensis]
MSVTSSLHARTSSSTYETRRLFLTLKRVVSGDLEVNDSVYASLGIERCDPRLVYQWPDNCGPFSSGAFADVFVAKKRPEPDSGLLPIRSATSTRPAADEEVAIKRIRRIGELSFDQQFKMWREVAVMRMLAKTPARAKSLLPLYDAFEWEGTLFLVMPLCRGGTLFDSGRISNESEAAAIAERTLRALETMHNMDCVHNDVKPANLMLLAKGSVHSVVLADYGESLIAGSSRTSNGTLPFAPPEWMEGRRKFSKASDVYSVGILVCFLLTGQTPFDPTAFGKAAGEGRLDSLPAEAVRFDALSAGVKAIPSQGAKDFVARCCQFDPDRRPTVEELLEHSWLKRHGLGKAAGRELTHVADLMRASLCSAKYAAAVDKGAAAGAIAPDADLQAKFQANSKLTRLALEAAFAAAAGAKTFLTQEQFKSLMIDLGCGEMPVKRLFSIFHAGPEPGVTLPELVKGLGVLQKESIADRIDLVIRLYADEDGCLSPDGVRRVLEASMDGKYLSHPAFVKPMARLRELTATLAVAGGGKLKKDAFAAAVKRDPMILRLFLAPGSLLREQMAWEWAQQFSWMFVGSLGETAFMNPIRTCYLVLLVLSAVLLVLHVFDVIDVDSAWASALALADRAI